MNDPKMFQFAWAAFAVGEKRICIYIYVYAYIYVVISRYICIYIHTYFTYKGGLSGSYLGWRQNNIAQKQRFIDNIEITRKRNEKLDALEIRMRNKGIILQEKGHHGSAKKLDQDMFKIPIEAEFDAEKKIEKDMFKIVEAEFDKVPDTGDKGDIEREITDTELHEKKHDKKITDKIEIYHDRKNEAKKDMIKIPVEAEFDKVPDGEVIEREITDTELHEDEHDKKITDKIEIYHDRKNEAKKDMIKIPVEAEFDKVPDGEDIEMEMTDTELHENEHDKKITDKIEIYHDRKNEV
jgi:hypothetical protein